MKLRCQGAIQNASEQGRISRSREKTVMNSKNNIKEVYKDVREQD